MMRKPLAFVIDDDESLGTAYTYALKLCGFETHYIQESETALDAIIDQKPVLIMLDMQMPKVSGLDILKALRTDERIKHTRVIMATANSYIAQDVVIDDLADIVLYKPVSMEQIRDFASRMVNELQDSTDPDAEV